MRHIPQEARVLRLLLPFIDCLYKIRKTIANEKRPFSAFRAVSFYAYFSSKSTISPM